MNTNKVEKTKAYLIKKTSPIFNKKGYYGTSLSDITNATKLTKGSIYGNFKDKDDVAVNCFLFNVNNITDEIYNNMQGAKNSLEKLLVFPKIYRKIFKDIIANGGCPIANTLIESDDTHPILLKLALDTLYRLENFLVSIIEEGLLYGEFIETTESHKTVQTIITLCEGGMILTKSTKKESYLINAIETIEEIIYSLKK
ncbi:TetR family transcriptional regulator [Bacillus mycoides]|uniref:TetR/AcrR family transcriptional regulator n=1 Tax=Bacillus mycoides TaxID=1405 RepID=UPI000B440954|nr:TetR/AcrR family transcriptional regulator [Bacillus mycoides]OTY21801.1 TetR family transcriptional regulator [Bacillus mycoides]QWI63665.1 TetR/AcrR family transcriptional regulator [Bacillus mycoides]